MKLMKTVLLILDLHLFLLLHRLLLDMWTVCLDLKWDLLYSFLRTFDVALQLLRFGFGWKGPSSPELEKQRVLLLVSEGLQIHVIQISLKGSSSILAL